MKQMLAWTNNLGSYVSSDKYNQIVAENARLKELNREMVEVIKGAQNELAFLHANDGRFGFASILNAIKEVLTKTGEGN